MHPISLSYLLILGLIALPFGIFAQQEQVKVDSSASSTRSVNEEIDFRHYAAQSDSGDLYLKIEALPSGRFYYEHRRLHNVSEGIQEFVSNRYALLPNNKQNGQQTGQMQRLEYRTVQIDSKGARLTGFVSYLVDSTGNTLPVFSEWGDNQLWKWNWDGGSLLRTWSESRRMDQRMAGLMGSAERIYVPGTDSLQIDGRDYPVIVLNDLIRLKFLDRAGGEIGEDFFLDFISCAKGIGMVLSKRQFSDGHSRTEKVIDILTREEWLNLGAE